MIVSKSDVLRHFVSREIQKHKDLAKELTDILSISNDEEFVSKLREFALRHDTGNPVYTWTGLNSNSHHQRVTRWTKVSNVEVNEIYSERINSSINTPLQMARGNLARIADLVPKDESLSKEFDLSRTPSSELDRIIIGVKRTTGHRDGTIELIDGAHRFVSMVANGVTTVPAYIAELN